MSPRSRETTRCLLSGGALVVLAGLCISCSYAPSSEARQPRSTTSTSRVGSSRAPATTTTTAPPKSVERAEADRLVAAHAQELMVPADVLPCVAQGLVSNPKAAGALAGTPKGDMVPGAVMDVSARCMRTEKALPALIATLDAQVKGGLTPAEEACVSRGYRKLPEAVLDAAAAEAVGGKDPSGAAKHLGEMLRACGVRVGG